MSLHTKAPEDPALKVPTMILQKECFNCWSDYVVNRIDTGTSIWLTVFVR
jgi:hypothetical protein